MEKNPQDIFLNAQFFTLDEKYRFSKTGTLLKIYGNLEYSFSNVETIGFCHVSRQRKPDVYSAVQRHNEKFPQSFSEL